MKVIAAHAPDVHVSLPAFIADAGAPDARRFRELFTVNIRNPNTRAGLWPGGCRVSRLVRSARAA